MDDAKIKAKAKAARLPKIMWDTPEFRGHLARIIEAEVASEHSKWINAALKARNALSDLIASRDPVVYADALAALDDAIDGE